MLVDLFHLVLGATCTENNSMTVLPPTLLFESPSHFKSHYQNHHKNSVYGGYGISKEYVTEHLRNIERGTTDM